MKIEAINEIVSTATQAILAFPAKDYGVQRIVVRVRSHAETVDVIVTNDGDVTVQPQRGEQR